MGHPQVTAMPISNIPCTGSYPLLFFFLSVFGKFNEQYLKSGRIKFLWVSVVVWAVVNVPEQGQNLPSFWYEVT